MEREIEIKLRLRGTPEETRRLLLELGAVPQGARFFEDNVVYDDEALTLTRAGRLLRLRRTDGPGRNAVLTWKEPVGDEEGRYKVRGETECRVDEPDSLDTILRRLGLGGIFRYQKYRSVFRFHQTEGELEVLLDETPIGDFLELEGPPGAIDACARRLGYGPDNYITLSYRGLQEALFEGTGREPGDMVFESE